MNEPNIDQANLIIARRSVQGSHENVCAVTNPLDLSPAQMETLHDLAGAGIDAYFGAHLIHKQTRQLIRRKSGTPHTLIYVPLRGAVEWRSGGRSWTVRPGQVVICGAMQPQEADSLEDYLEVISLHTHIRLAGMTPDQPLFCEMAHTLPGDVGFWHEKLDAITTLCDNRHFAEMTANIIRLLLVELALRGAALVPHRRVTDPRVWRVMELLHEQVGNPRVLHEACRAAKVSASHLRLLFRRHLGVSPSVYNQDLRIREVLRLISESRLSIKEIAANLGYTDQQHLEKDFKKRFGVAPGKYRQSL